jgi:hypothetical protein
MHINVSSNAGNVDVDPAALMVDSTGPESITVRHRYNVLFTVAMIQNIYPLEKPRHLISSNTIECPTVFSPVCPSWACSTLFSCVQLLESRNAIAWQDNEKGL